MDETENIKTAIQNFLQERLQPKLDKLKEGEEGKRKQLIADHKPEAWIADAARRAGQIQQVTHALKYTHPDAKGTNLTSHGNPAAGERLVGTHTIRNTYTPDVVGNAAALDVYKFLRLDVDGKPLLQRAGEGDPALEAALSDNSGQAKSWMRAFARLTEGKGEPASHKLAKQLYWPLDDGQYHLLSPLFPTSLAHRVWTTIQENRYSETTRDARRARRENKPHPSGYHEYPSLAIQKFGGTKPQNISQLNSERRGENYLLPSLPPQWESIRIKPPLRVTSIFGRWFGRRPDVQNLIRILRKFLINIQDSNNVHIRRKRAELVDYLCDELIQFAAGIQQLPGGWSRDKQCRLNREEQFWLDPKRAREDETFADERTSEDWQTAICERFGKWLNARLTTDRTPMGDPEYREWRDELGKRINTIRTELDHHE